MAGEDKKYTGWLRTQACRGCDRHLESISPHHSTGGGKGMSTRNHDHTAMPMCSDCHAELHQFKGRFKAMTRHMRDRWQKDQVDYLRRIYVDDMPF